MSLSWVSLAKYGVVDKEVWVELAKASSTYERGSIKGPTTALVEKAVKTEGLKCRYKVMRMDSKSIALFSLRKGTR